LMMTVILPLFSLFANTDKSIAANTASRYNDNNSKNANSNNNSRNNNTNGNNEEEQG